MTSGRELEQLKLCNIVSKEVEAKNTFKSHAKLEDSDQPLLLQSDLSPDYKNGEMTLALFS